MRRQRGRKKEKKSRIVMVRGPGSNCWGIYWSQLSCKLWWELFISHCQRWFGATKFEKGTHDCLIFIITSYYNMWYSGKLVTFNSSLFNSCYHVIHSLFEKQSCRASSWELTCKGAQACLTTLWKLERLRQLVRPPRRVCEIWGCPFLSLPCLYHTTSGQRPLSC